MLSNWGKLSNFGQVGNSRRRANAGATTVMSSWEIMSTHSALRVDENGSSECVSCALWASRFVNTKLLFEVTEKEETLWALGKKGL